MKALYDKLANLLRGMKPERREAFGDYLSEREAEEHGEEKDTQGADNQ